MLNNNDLFANEKNEIKLLLDNPNMVNDKPIEVMRLYIKYLCNNYENKEDIEKEYFKFLKNNFIYYVEDDWIDEFNRNFRKFKNEVLIGDYIIRVPYEFLQCLMNINDDEKEYILFVLFIFKFTNVVTNNNDLMMNVFKYSKFKYNKNARANNRATQRKMIIKSVESYVDMLNQYIKNIDKYDCLEFIINNINEHDMILEYINYKNPDYCSRCEICNTLIIKTNKTNRKKYCKQCARIMKYKQKSKYKQIIRMKDGL